VTLTVKITVVEGKCQEDQHKVGDTWTIGYKTPKGICLGAWGAVYPYVMALNLGGSFSWKKESAKIKLPCADTNGITLLVERIEKE